MIQRFPINKIPPAPPHRYFGKGLQLRRQGKKHGYTHDEAKLQICYSDYDIELDEDGDDFDVDLQDMTFEKVNFSLSDIRESVEEVFEDTRQLEYYDDGTTPTTTTNKYITTPRGKTTPIRKPQWRPLTDLNTPEMQVFRGGKKILKVRVPQFYDDTPMNVDKDHDDDEADNSDYRDDDGYIYEEDDDGNLVRKEKKRKGLLPDDIELELSVMYLEGMIKDLASKLKEQKYYRADGVIYGENGSYSIVYSMIQAETNTKIMTKDFVLQEADSNRDLSRLLLSLPGSLDHIVQALHYDLLWEHQPRPRRLHNGYRRR